MKKLLSLLAVLCLFFALSTSAPAGVIMPDATPTPTPTPAAEMSARPDESDFLGAFLAWLGF